MTKKFVWMGFFVGSSIGNMVPVLWGGDVMSVSGIVLALVGGVIGMWLGRRFAESL